jgi:acetyl-CoA carboxylase alpha subunit
MELVAAVVILIVCAGAAGYLWGAKVKAAAEAEATKVVKDVAKDAGVVEAKVATVVQTAASDVTKVADDVVAPVVNVVADVKQDLGK